MSIKIKDLVSSVFREDGRTVKHSLIKNHLKMEHHLNTEAQENLEAIEFQNFLDGIKGSMDDSMKDFKIADIFDLKTIQLLSDSSFDVYFQQLLTLMEIIKSSKSIGFRLSNNDTINIQNYIFLVRKLRTVLPLSVCSLMVRLDQKDQEVIDMFKGAIASMISKKLTLSNYLTYVVEDKSLNEEMSPEDFAKIQNKYMEQMSDYLDDEVNRIFDYLTRDLNDPSLKIIPYQFGLKKVTDIIKKYMPELGIEIDNLTYGDATSFKELVIKFTEEFKNNEEIINEIRLAQEEFISINNFHSFITLSNIFYVIFNKVSNEIAACSYNEEDFETTFDMLTDDAKLLITTIDLVLGSILNLTTDPSENIYVEEGVSIKLLAAMSNICPFQLIGNELMRNTDNISSAMINNLHHIIYTDYIEKLLSDTDNEALGKYSLKFNEIIK